MSVQITSRNSEAGSVAQPTKHRSFRKEFAQRTLHNNILKAAAVQSFVNGLAKRQKHLPKGRMAKGSSNRTLISSIPNSRNAIIVVTGTVDQPQEGYNARGRNESQMMRKRDVCPAQGPITEHLNKICN